MLFMHSRDIELIVSLSVLVVVHYGLDVVVRAWLARGRSKYAGMVGRIRLVGDFDTRGSLISLFEL